MSYKEYYVVIIRGILGGYHTGIVSGYHTRNMVVITQGMFCGYHTVVLTLSLHIIMDCCERLVAYGSISTAQGTLLKANYSQYQFDNLYPA